MNDSTLSNVLQAGVEQWNDRSARLHDIDAYYTRASWAVRAVERVRLSWICRTVGQAVGQRVLEVGCGGGHVLRMFPRAHLTGVDVSGVMLDKACRNLADLDATLLKGELGTLPLPERHFDWIICTEVIEHVVDPETLLSQMARLLHESGHLVITFPNDRLIDLIKSILVRSGLTRWPGLSRISWGGDEFHLHAWTCRQMKTLLSPAYVVDRMVRIPSRFLPIRYGFACRPRA